MKISKGFFRIQHIDPVLFSEKIDEFVKFGLGVELRDFMLPALLDSSEDLAIWVKAYRGINNGRINLSVHGPVIDLNLGSLDEKIRQVSIERITQVLKVTKELSVEFLIIHNGYDRRFLNERSRFKGWVERSLESFSLIFKEVNLTKYLKALCIENSPGEPLETYWVYLCTLRDRFAGIPIYACIDYEHLILKEKQLIHQYLKDPMVIYLHLPWRNTISQAVCQNLPTRHNLQSICFEGEFGNKAKQKIQKLMIDG